MSVLGRFFDSNEREIDGYRKRVGEIGALEADFQRLSDEELQQTSTRLREKLASGIPVDDILPEAFAAVREAGVRKLGMRHYDVQLIGAMVLHDGRIAEMKTGEGKTLVATLPLFLNALEGKGAHLVTANDYLARRDRDWMAPLYEALGLSVGVIQHGQSHEEKQHAYRCDITYGTNNEFGFDYLRDNMAPHVEYWMQRELHYGIVDEVDSILIDEARTPLIISGHGERPTDLIYKVDKIVAGLRKDADFTVDEKARTAMLTDDGTRRVEQLLGIVNLADLRNLQHMQFVTAALKAHNCYKRDVHYLVKDGEVVIIDEFTGRLMFGRRWSDGIHQAVEAKEGLQVGTENQTLATITFQNYFRLYNKLAGMTGTAKTEEEEFRKIYALDVVMVPTHRPMIRKDHADVVYKTEESKIRGLCCEILGLWVRRQPVLVGTRSVEMSERIEARLTAPRLKVLAMAQLLANDLATKKLGKEKEQSLRAGLFRPLEDLTMGDLQMLAKDTGRDPDVTAPQNLKDLAAQIRAESGLDERFLEAFLYGIPNKVLNAKFHEKEAEIIAEAGRAGAVTIATNMAGRGVDILLGGRKTAEGEDRAQEATEVINLGGLSILGSERHESRRIDNQLRGRSGRQGDPGMSRFYVSMSDELMRLFGDKSQSLMFNLWPEEQPVEAKLVSRSIEKAQKKVEAHNFEIRKDVLRYDDVMNLQRNIIYTERKRILQGVDLRANVKGFIDEIVDAGVKGYCPEGVRPAEWDIESLYQLLNQTMPLEFILKPEQLEGKGREELREQLKQAGSELLEKREEGLPQEVIPDLYRWALLTTIDSRWIEHLESMDYLREGIGLRGYAQVDPIIPYANEAYEMFQHTLQSIREEVVSLIFRAQIVQRPQETTRSVYHEVEEAMESIDGRVAPVRVEEKVGRNDPCPCGSGKKYKKCCMLKESVS